MNITLASLLLITATYIAWRAGRNYQQATDLTTVTEVIEFICNDYNLPGPFAKKLIRATQLGVIYTHPPTCSCNNHVLVTEDEHVHKDGIIHTMNGCDFE